MRTGFKVWAWFFVSLTGLATLTAQNAAQAPLRKAAIIVENRAGPQWNDKVSVFEDMVSSRVAGNGISLISRDVVVNALKSYSSKSVAVTSEGAMKADAQANRNAAAQAEAGLGDKTATAHGKVGTEASLNANAQVSSSGTMQASTTDDTTKLDQALADNTSALRLAQNLGADFILIPAITSYGTEKKSYSGNGIATVNITHTLRVNYRIVEAGEGGAMKGAMVTATKTIRQSEGLQVDSTDIMNELLDDAAGQLAGAIQKSVAELPKEVAKAAMVNLRVACTMTDPRQQPILIPAINLTPDNKVVVTNPPVPLQAMDVTVELDGVAIGSAPGEFKARPGLHKIRLSREGFDDWARTINIYDGQNLRVAMQMSEAGYARWAETTAFLATLDNNRKLTDAEVKRIEGIAKFFSESHYRVDTKENLKIYKSLY